MKILYFATPDIALETLESLNQSEDIEILAVITQPDKKSGRKKLLTAPPVKALAKELNIEVKQPNTQEELRKVLKNYKADFFVVFAYGMILKKEILNMPRIAAINIHTSLLPKYRGASPIQEAIKKGDKETGISIMKMDEKLDHGDIYLVKRINIEEDDNSETLTSKLSKASSSIIPHALRDIQNNELSSIPQDHQKASYCKKIKKEDGEINLNLTAIEIKNKIRAYHGWPTSWIKYKDKKIKIIKTEISSEEIGIGHFKIKDQELLIGTGKGSLVPSIVQLEGKKPVDIKNFINGYKNLFQD